MTLSLAIFLHFLYAKCLKGCPKGGPSALRYCVPKCERVPRPLPIRMSPSSFHADDMLHDIGKTIKTTKTTMWDDARSVHETSSVI